MKTTLRQCPSGLGCAVANESHYNVNFDNLRIAHKLAKVMEVNNYYPGVNPERSRRRLLNSSMSFSRSGNKLKYQTKEQENYLDYNVLDFGARHGVYPERILRNAAITRWTVADPIIQYANLNIALGANPVSMVDPDEMAK